MRRTGAEAKMRKVGASHIVVICAAWGCDPAIDIEGVVVDANGRPVPGATVDLECSAGRPPALNGRVLISDPARFRGIVRWRVAPPEAAAEEPKDSLAPEGEAASRSSPHDGSFGHEGEPIEHSGAHETGASSPLPRNRPRAGASLGDIRARRLGRLVKLLYSVSASRGSVALANRVPRDPCASAQGFCVTLWHLRRGRGSPRRWRPLRMPGRGLGLVEKGEWLFRRVSAHEGFALGFQVKRRS
jgi:hypothetical protein